MKNENQLLAGRSISQYLHVALPLTTVKIDYNYTKLERIPILFEAVIRLLTICGHCSPENIRSFLSLSMPEVKILLADLVEQKLIRNNGNNEFENVNNSSNLCRLETEQRVDTLHLVDVGGRFIENPESDLCKKIKKSNGVFFVLFAEEGRHHFDVDSIRRYFTEHFDRYEDGKERYFHSVNYITVVNQEFLAFPIKLNFSLDKQDEIYFSLIPATYLNSAEDEILKNLYRNTIWNSVFDKPLLMNNSDIGLIRDWLPQFAEITESLSLRDLYSKIAYADFQLKLNDGIILSVPTLSGKYADEEFFLFESDIFRMKILELRINHGKSIPKIYYKIAFSVNACIESKLKIKQITEGLIKDERTGNEFGELMKINISRELRNEVESHFVSNECINLARVLGSENVSFFCLENARLMVVYYATIGMLTVGERSQDMRIPLFFITDNKDIVDLALLVSKFYVEAAAQYRVMKSVSKPVNKGYENGGVDFVENDKSVVTARSEEIPKDVISATSASSEQDSFLADLVRTAVMEAQKTPGARIPGTDLGQAFKIVTEKRKLQFSWSTYGYLGLKDYLMKHPKSYTVTSSIGKGGVKLFWVGLCVAENIRFNKEFLDEFVSCAIKMTEKIPGEPVLAASLGNSIQILAKQRELDFRWTQFGFTGLRDYVCKNKSIYGLKEDIGLGGVKLLWITRLSKEVASDLLNEPPVETLVQYDLVRLIDTAFLNVRKNSAGFAKICDIDKYIKTRYPSVSWAMYGEETLLPLIEARSDRYEIHRDFASNSDTSTDYVRKNR